MRRGGGLLLVWLASSAGAAASDVPWGYGKEDGPAKWAVLSLD